MYVSKMDGERIMHTKNNFKTWLKTAKYTEVLDLYQEYRTKLMNYRMLIAKTKTLYPKEKGSHMKNITIVKYKLNLLSNWLNNKTIQRI